MEMFREIEGELSCEGVPLSEIAGAVGTPCYVYSEATVRQRFEEFTAAFTGVPARILYSVKANHNLAILRVFRSLGAGADVVSLGELHRARLAGFQGHDIVFGGVGKSEEELHAALTAGVLVVHVESERELRSLDALAVARGMRAPVAIRVNPGVQAGMHNFTQTGHYNSKFGVAWEDAERLYVQASRLDGVEVVGIDAHIGSQILDHRPYLEMLDRLSDLLVRIYRGGLTLKYLDIGGGFGVEYGSGKGIDLSAVAKAAGMVASEFHLTCLVEPGRWLVAPAGVLLTRVLYRKKLGDRVYYVTDAGSNDFVRPSYYDARHPIEAVRRGPATTVADIVGPVCEAGDFLGRDRGMPAVNEGDLLAVLYAGAYGFVMSSNYNSRLRAAEVLVRDDTYRVVRRRESLEDLVAQEDVEQDGN